MRKILIILGIMLVFLTGCDYKYAGSWQSPRQFDIEDAYSKDPGVADRQLSEMLSSCKSSLSLVLDRKATSYLLWRNFDEVNIRLINRESENNLSENSDAYYDRNDNTIYVLEETTEKGQNYMLGVICHELVHALTWSDSLNSMLSEGIADAYAARALEPHGIHYEITYLNATFVVLCLESCYGSDLLELAISGKLPDKIDQDLGKTGMGQKLDQTLSAVYYFDYMAPDESNFRAALLAQCDILSHLAAATGRGQSTVKDLVGSYELPEQEYFFKVIEAR